MCRMPDRALYGRATVRGEPAIDPPRLAPFERRPFPRRLRTGLTIGLVGLVYAWRFGRFQRQLASVGAALPVEDRRRYRLLRRYTAGAAAGYLASRYGLARSSALRQRLLYADVAALWSNFLIAADGAMDSKALSLSESVALLRAAFHALYDPVQSGLPRDVRSSIADRYFQVFATAYGQPPDALSYRPDHAFRLERYAVATASQLGSRIAEIQTGYLGSASAAPFSTALAEFYHRALDLADGQLASLEQTLVDDEHDWGWYRNVLDKKLVNVLLAPFSLLVNPSSQINPGEVARQYFSLINRVFFHRQVLDDLLDFEEDLASKTANSLIYMLVSQGRIAEAMANSDMGENTESVVRELQRSGTMAPEFSAGGLILSPDERSSRSAESIAVLVRHALANGALDRGCPLDELLLRCRQRKAELLRAWAKGEWETIREIVEQSGIATRILESIASMGSHGEIEQALIRLGDGDIREMMYVFYARTLRTYQRCVSEWRHRDGDPRFRFDRA